MGESLQIDQPEQDAIDGEGTEVDEAVGKKKKKGKVV
jgi:hypothetical protein